MRKRILLSGVLGGIVLLVWTFIANAGFGLASRVEMNRVPNERAVYSILRETVVAPGVYIANPEPVPEVGYPPGEPVYGIRYSGHGHEIAGPMSLVELALMVIAAGLTAVLLSLASPRILGSFGGRFAFVAGVGLLLAIVGDLPKFGIGGYPLASALMLGANRLLSWAAAGLVIAWAMRRPRQAAVAS